MTATDFCSFPFGARIVLQYERVGRDNSGPTTAWLFVPGMWCGSRWGFGLWPSLAVKNGAAGAMLLLRGHCDSLTKLPEPPALYATLEDYVDDILSAFDELAKRFEKIVLCGHSMGGLLLHMVGQRMNAEQRAKLRAIVTVCESTTVTAQMAITAVASKSLLDIMRGRPFKPDPRDVEKLVIPMWDLDRPPSFGYESGVAARQILLGQGPKLESALQPRVPYVVVGCSNDPIVPLKATIRTYEKLVRAGHQAEHITLHSGGHMVMLCKESAQNFETVWQAVQRTTGATNSIPATADLVEA